MTVTKAEFGPLEAHDARAAGLDHFDPSADAQAELFQALDFGGWSQEFVDVGELAGIQDVQGDGIEHGIAGAD